jgi:hypothetical protein
VFHNLKSALDRAGILDWSAYMIEPTDGFVIVARMESINRDGRPLDGQNRWLSEGRPSFTSVFELLERLVTASTGRYRVIVLAYTGRTVVADPNEVPNSLPQLATQGPASLPPALAATPSPSAVACVALVYEFQKLPGRDPEWLDASRSGLTAKQHLVGAGLWKEAELYNE